MLKLKRLRVERFRSLAAPAELLFSDGINVVLGQNGTGKTTLLELISMVVRSDFSSLAKEEFAVEYELVNSNGVGIGVTVKNERTTAGHVPAPVDRSPREVFHSSAEIRDGADRSKVVRYSVEDGWRGESTLEKLLMDSGPLDFGFLILASYVWALELADTVSAVRMDESLDLFRTLVGGESSLGRFIILNPSWVPLPDTPMFVPNSLLELLRASYKRETLDYSFAHSDLDFLAALKATMGFASVSIRVDVSKPSPISIQFSNLVFRFTWDDGTLITHERLSYGQKRLVAFFYYVACNPSIVIADELVNGLHHRWITAAIEALGERQAFLTSQNPLLLDYVAVTSASEVRSSFVLCRGEPRDGRPGWIWENMSEEDADELFAAHEVGIEHVSEILQSRGLW